MSETNPVEPTIDMPTATTISAEAQAILAYAASVPAMTEPAPDDEAGWQQLGAFAATADPGTATALALATTGAVPSETTGSATAHDVNGARFFIADPPPSAADAPTDAGTVGRVLFAIHGGSFTFGGGESARISTELLAANYGVRTWGMDYRQLPDHPFPAGLEDCVAVYRRLLETVDPSSVVVLGQSGGGNLAAALMLRAHEEGLPRPAALALLSPAVDLTQEGDTYRTNGFTIARNEIGHVFARYASGADLTDPHVSPLLGDVSVFPPTILTAGTRDFLLSDTVRMHRALRDAGITADLHVWEGAPHGLFMGRAPEDREQVAEVRRFFEREWEQVGA